MHMLGHCLDQFMYNALFVCRYCPPTRRHCCQSMLDTTVRILSWTVHFGGTHGSQVVPLWSRRRISVIWSATLQVMSALIPSKALLSLLLPPREVWVHLLTCHLLWRSLNCRLRLVSPERPSHTGGSGKVALDPLTTASPCGARSMNQALICGLMACVYHWRSRTSLIACWRWGGATQTKRRCLPSQMQTLTWRKTGHSLRQFAQATRTSSGQATRMRARLMNYPGASGEHPWVLDWLHVCSVLSMYTRDDYLYWFRPININAQCCMSCRLGGLAS